MSSFSFFLLLAAAVAATVGEMPYPEGDDEPASGAQILQIILSLICKPYWTAKVLLTPPRSGQDNRFEVDDQHRKGWYLKWNNYQPSRLAHVVNSISFGGSTS